MRYALKDNVRVGSTKGIDNVFCECCHQPVKAYCGQINIEHFRHLNKNDCDKWYEPISQWHLDWQNKFPEHFREVVISRNGSSHRSDIINSKGTVIEFQKSFINPFEIKERESFYNTMIWVFSGVEFRNNFKLKFKWTHKFKTENKEIKGYNWLHPKKHIFSCEKPVFIDFGTDYLYWINFLVKKMPLFRSSFSREEDYEYWDGGLQSASYYINETEYYWHPIRLIEKNKFIQHYCI